jgi:uncharacterized protein (UPF0332 family)
MNLSASERRALIRLRLANALQALADAAALRQANSIRGATNRAYYAMFYAAAAMAVQQGQSFRKHTGLLAYIHREWVATGQLDKTHGRALQRAFESRSEGDYQDVLRLTGEDVDQLIADATAFIGTVQSILGVSVSP